MDVLSSTMTERPSPPFDPAMRGSPPLRGDEPTTLRSFLDYHRDTFRWKCGGLTREQMARSLPPSDMTLGGMMKHLTLVESGWFESMFAGRGSHLPPLGSGSWAEDRDWEWRTARHESPEQLRALFDEAVRRSDAIIDDALQTWAGPERESARQGREDDGRYSLRWILLHMIAEYARHNGHADLIRQSIDGQTG